MYLKFILGPLHLLVNFVKEILASDSTKSYLRKEQDKIRDHPFKTSANFYTFLTPTPLP